MPNAEHTEILLIGKPIKMLVGGLYNEFNSDYDTMPGHTKGKGFSLIIDIEINPLDGTIT